MFIRRFFNYRTTTVVLLALILSAVAYGFAAGNTVNATDAGEGEQTISGYSVDVSYNLNTSNPTLVDSVDLTLSPTTATDVQVNFDSVTADWNEATCTGSGGSWTCSFAAPVSVDALDYIQVVAVE